MKSKIKSFKVRSVNQRSNLRQLCEPLGGSEGLIKTVGFKKTRESRPMWGGTSTNVSGSEFLEGHQR